MVGTEASDLQTWVCPHGHGTLVRNDANGVHHTCSACRGFAVTIWLLDELLADGVGAGLWRSSAPVAADGDPCPVCTQPMRPVPPPMPAVEGGRLEVCRACEVVWIDALVISSLPVHPAVATLGAAAPDPASCPVCGAPYRDYLADRCRYCRARIARAPEVPSGPEIAEEQSRDRSATRWPRDIVHESIEKEYGI